MTRRSDERHVGVASQVITRQRVTGKVGFGEDMTASRRSWTPASASRSSGGALQLRRIRYVDFEQEGEVRFLVAITFAYAE